MDVNGASAGLCKIAQGGADMGLSSELLETDMAVPCPRCSREIVHKGKWFKAVAHVDCPFCGFVMLWGYEMKLRLFALYEPVTLVHPRRPPVEMPVGYRCGFG